MPFLVLLSVTVCLLPLSLCSGPVSVTTSGQVSGFWSSSFSGRTYASFTWIPYAKPPVGDLRFLRPQPPDPWTGTLRATTEVKCIHKNTFVRGEPVEGQEDCLVVNVFTPSMDKGLLPVMVFIHGGGYVAGSGGTDFYGPDMFMDKDVVLVTVNYRLSVLGGLFLDGDLVSGRH